MFARFACLGLFVVVALMVAGCQPGEGSADGSNAKLTGQAPTPTEMAAYAGRHNFPNMEATNDHQIGAIVSTDKNSIRLYNFSNEPLGEIDVWVNSSYVQHITSLPAKGSVIIKGSELYNNFGKTFASQSEPVSRVQIMVGNTLRNVMGPLSQ